ncbi:hypothetical protein ZIOFF_056968 [Zingiber officinale]|uniref:Uncharacterized protein n=1 Tax=Zingiber officinale TaxID=94328 RepID=A0A8J5KQP7_ZINOF|nr:hypothetical protein ZIOFF_056968 [Zingiber officinale]
MRIPAVKNDSCGALAGSCVHHVAFKIWSQPGEQSDKIVLLLRLVPLLPFNMLNYLLSVTPVSIGAYMMASWIGMMVNSIRVNGNKDLGRRQQKGDFGMTIRLLMTIDGVTHKTQVRKQNGVKLEIRTNGIAMFRKAQEADGSTKTGRNNGVRVGSVVISGVEFLALLGVAAYFWCGIKVVVREESSSVGLEEFAKGLVEVGMWNWNVKPQRWKMGRIVWQRKVWEVRLQ